MRGGLQLRLPGFQSSTDSMAPTGQHTPAPDALGPLEYEVDPPRRPTHVRYGVMAFLCALSFLTYFDRVCIVGRKATFSATWA